MSSFTIPFTILHAHITQSHHRSRHRKVPAIPSAKETPAGRRKFLATTTSLAVGLNNTTQPPPSMAENWGTRSFLWERFAGPGLSPEDSAARIKQTAEGLHSIRDMLENMSWRYVLFYIRLKSAYLSQDMKAAFPMVPVTNRNSYIKTANELVDNMAEFDSYVRSPKVYESYLFYEKTLKSIDELVALLP